MTSLFKRLPKPKSLAARLFLTGAIWSLLALAGAAFILTSLHRASVESGFDQRLDNHLSLLIGETSQIVETGGFETAIVSLGDAQFDLPLSGWYWIIRDKASATVLLTSDSIFGETFNLPSDDGVEADDTGYRKAYGVGPDGKFLRILERDITIGDKVYTIAVSGDFDELQAEIGRFEASTVLTLAAFGLGLLMTTYLLVRIGLRPLDDIRAGLTRIRQGDADRLDGSFPTEIEPLVLELNELIKSVNEVIERARTHVGNLAHALKTPLSVITNEARRSETDFADKISEQADLMRGQVQTYLDRARMAARVNTITSVTDVAFVVDRLVRAMRRIYEARGIRIELGPIEGLRFRGEQQDLEEMLGNLIDNACKYSDGEVQISFTYAPDPDRQRAFLHICIDDNGPGLTEDQCKEAMRRGRRFDETKPGSGLGLNIVNELAELYGGTLRLTRSTLGGLRVELVVPSPVREH
ncbi:HAMP domain-containing sensor histidine kinase [Coralliovum pocilloporae]|uniref:HAMP domain-containing sensor histidine kinase n=1 Tax=Coralliovum pocilloporae TaxID=3066369 RepID=UPI003307A952